MCLLNSHVIAVTSRGNNYTSNGIKHFFGQILLKTLCCVHNPYIWQLLHPQRYIGERFGLNFNHFNSRKGRLYLCLLGCFFLPCVNWLSLSRNLLQSHVNITDRFTLCIRNLSRDKDILQ